MITGEPRIVKSFRPSIPHYWRVFALAAFALFMLYGIRVALHYRALYGVSRRRQRYLQDSFGMHDAVRNCPQCLLVKRGPVSRKFKEITYGDINKILVTQGSMQKRFGVGNIIIGTEQAEYRLRG